MNRLPGYDSKTSNAERAVYLTLGLSAGVLGLVAAYNGMRFAGERERIIMSLENCPAELQNAGLSHEHPVTNLTSVQPPHIVRPPRS